MPRDDHFLTITVLGATALTASLWAVTQLSPPRPNEPVFAETPTLRSVPAPRRSLEAFTPNPPQAASQEPAAPAAPIEIEATSPESPPAVGLVLASDLEPAPIVDSGLAVAAVVRAVEAMHQGRVADLPALDLPSFAELTVRRDDLGRTVVASGSLRRWEAAANLIATIPVERVDPWISSNAGAISRVLPGGAQRLRGLVAETAHRLADLELPNEKPELSSRGLSWEPVEPRFRELPPLDRHLVLMSRDDAEQIQQVLARLAELLDLSSTASLGLPAVDLGEISTAQTLTDAVVDPEVVEP